MAHKADNIYYLTLDEMFSNPVLDSLSTFSLQKKADELCSYYFIQPTFIEGPLSARWSVIWKPPWHM